MYILENGFKKIVILKQARNVQPSLSLGTVLLLLLRCGQRCGQAIAACAPQYFSLHNCTWASWGWVNMQIFVSERVDAEIY